jgi:hypothetical protein
LDPEPDAVQSGRAGKKGRNEGIYVAETMPSAPSDAAVIMPDPVGPWTFCSVDIIETDSGFDIITTTSSSQS